MTQIATDPSRTAVSKKNRKIGLILIIGPMIGLILTLFLWAVATFVVAQIGSPVPTGNIGTNEALSLAAPSPVMNVMSVINVILGLLGLVCVLGIMIGIPVGIIFLAKQEPLPEGNYDQRSGDPNLSALPEGVAGWNWGAAGLPIIWGLYHGVWFSLWALLPIVNLPIRIYLGLHGNEYAWKRNRWVSVHQFQTSQEKWKIWGIIFVIISLLPMIQFFVS